MAKTKISEYSSTASDNTDINGIDLGEGTMLVSDVNNALREQMAQLKNFITGTGGDALAVAAGGTGSSTADGALTNLGGTTVGTAVFKAATVNAAQQALDLEVGVDVQAYDADTAKTDVANTWTAAQIFSSSTNLSYGTFRKADPTIVAWTKTGAGTATTSTTLYVEVNGSIKTIASGTSITMPSLSAGTDYAIWAKTDGTLEATNNHTSPPTANARKVGGFHYAPGGNATGTSGGNTTAQINEYSFWDLKFRPSCPDPRGMTLVANAFWADIYLCGVDHYTNGTSKYNVTIADGSSPPKVSAAFGGNGSTDYGGFTWFEANEVMIGHGKKLPTYTEAMTYAYGTTEASSGGTDPVSTILRQAYTSKWGVMLATGNIWQWLRDFIADGTGTFAWQAITESRGSVGTLSSSARAGIFGGNWNGGSDSGSRCSVWDAAPSISNGGIGARGVCDHLQLD